MLCKGAQPQARGPHCGPRKNFKWSAQVSFEIRTKLKNPAKLPSAKERSTYPTQYARSSTPPALQYEYSLIMLRETIECARVIVLLTVESKVF